MAFESIARELDDIANSLEKRGFKKLASRLDMVSNTLEAADRRIASRRKAAPNDLMPSAPDGPPPGSEDADEAGHYDAYEAKNYHKVPVGKDSLSKMLGAPSPADMLNRLEIAAEGQINIQASRRRKAEVAPMDVDEGDAADPFTTAGLPESGDETQGKPVDEDQEGGTLEFYGTEAPGTLHMPTNGGGSTDDVENILEEAEEYGEDNEDGVEEVALKNRLSSARNILRRTAADIVVEDPADLHDSETGDNVERDQPLGGLGNGPVSASRRLRFYK